MTPRKKRVKLFNTEALVKAVILLGFVTLLVWLVLTEQLPLYINPRFSLLIELSCGLLIPMFIIQLLDFLIPDCASNDLPCHTHTGRWHFIPFLAVLSLAFALPDNTLNANLVNSKGLNSQISVISTSSQDQPRPLASEFHQQKLIKVTNLNYTEAVSEINNFPQDYTGKNVVMTGFVFRSPGLTSNQFSLVRYVIMCCTADSLPYGVMCETAAGKNYADGTWLTVEGVIKMSKYEDGEVPTVKITSMQQIDVPKDPYVYPYN